MNAMSEASGEIYFIGETDYLTKEPTSFYKIGLVREAEGRDSESRLLEHQTGNPRTLSIDCIIKTPLVDYIESLLHGLYASNRVEGEWFHLDATELAAATSSAENMAAEAEVALPIWIKAAELKGQAASGDELDPTDEQRLVHVEFLKADLAVKELGKLSKRITVILGDAIEAGEDVGDVATKQQHERGTFSETKFQANHPTLFDAYQKISESLTGSFLPKKTKNDPAVNEFREKVLNPILGPLDVVITAAETGLTAKSELNSTKLTILAHLAKYTWLAENARRKLQVACGTAPGITGLCTWNRIIKTTAKLDRAKLKLDHPEEYASCVEVKQIDVVKVQPRQV
jgi:hypothetical protein